MNDRFVLYCRIPAVMRNEVEMENRHRDSSDDVVRSVSENGQDCLFEVNSCV